MIRSAASSRPAISRRSSAAPTWCWSATPSRRRASPRAILAQLTVGAVDKAVEIVCQRTVIHDGEVRDGARWMRMPLRYERAAGGPGTWNPVGISLEAAPDPLGRRFLANLQPPGLSVTRAGDAIPPAGFGPIAASWSSRREHLRDPAGPWTEARLADEPLDEDFDLRFFQSAPADQQIDLLLDDELITLENLHPEHPRLSTRLPGLHPRAFVDVPGALTTELPLTADTLWIDTDRALCTVTWRGQLPLGRRDQPGRVVIAAEPSGQRLTWASVQALIEPVSTPPGSLSLKVGPPSVARSRAQGSSSEEHTMPGMVLPSRSPLPFSAPPTTPLPNRPAIPAEPASLLQPTGPRTTRQVVATENPATVLPWDPGDRSTSRPTPLPPSPRIQSMSSAPVPILAPRFGEPPPPLAPALPVEGSMPPPMPTLGQTYVAGRPSFMLPTSAAPAPLAAPPMPTSSARPQEPGKVTSGAVEEKALSQAGFTGALAASNAAAGAQSTSAATARMEPSAAASASTLLEIIWFDEAFLPRVRKTPEWSPLMKPPPRKLPAQRQAPQQPPPEDPTGAARAEIAKVLAGATPLSPTEIEDAIERALGEGDDLMPPLVLVSGELELPFDERSLLEATATTAAPLAALDKKLKETLDVVAEVLKSASPVAPDVLDGLLTRVREAWSRANRVQPANYLVTQPERGLLEQRRYQKRELLDAEWIRALFHAGGEAPIPAYLPAALARKLPLFRRFPARIIAEALPQQDQYERQLIALRVAALARVVQRRSRTPSQS